MTTNTAKLAALLCPGRGSYGREELGSLATLVEAARAAGSGNDILSALAAMDVERAAAGKPELIDLDAATSFKPSQHLDGENAALLIYFCTLLHSARATQDHDVLCVGRQLAGLVFRPRG